MLEWEWQEAGSKFSYQKWKLKNGLSRPEPPLSHINQPGPGARAVFRLRALSGAVSEPGWAVATLLVIVHTQSIRLQK